MDLFAGLPAADLSAYTDPQVAFAREAWPLRAGEELRSALIFRALARASRLAPVCAAWTARFSSAVRDEVFHARLCAAIGSRVGASVPIYDARPVHARLAPLTEPTRRACALTLIEVAVGETISMAMFRAARRSSREPLTRAALERILADEVRHQRLGWSAIFEWWPALDSQHREALQEEVRWAFGAMEQRIAAPALARLVAGTAFDPAYGELGVLAPEARVDAFYAAIEHLVIPRLSRLGIEGGRAWRDRYRREGV